MCRFWFTIAILAHMIFIPRVAVAWVIGHHHHHQYHHAASQLSTTGPHHHHHQSSHARVTRAQQQQLPRTALFLFDWWGSDNKQDNDSRQQKQQKQQQQKVKSSVDENSSSTTTSDDAEPDLVERFYTAIFGKPEQSPFGLKRFDSNRFPEQYPATTTEWADPVVGDNKVIAPLRALLKNTNLERRLLTLSYDASKMGWDAIAFHTAVDRKGPAFVVCTTTDGLICGGYNPKGWVGYGEARGSIAAFLFTESNVLLSSSSSSTSKTSKTTTTISDGGRIDPISSSSSSSWIKLRKVGGASLAQLDQPETGPCFGADSLVIPLGKDAPKRARSKLGSYYERLPDGSNSLFGARRGGSIQLKSLQVYHGVWGPDEYIPFTDAEPFALY